MTGTWPVSGLLFRRIFLNIRKDLDDLIQTRAGSSPVSLQNLLSFAREQKTTGLAVAKQEERALYLAFVEGEPEGAVFSDENGELYGDKAAVRLNGDEFFEFYPLPNDLISALVMGCRVFEKSHLKGNRAADLPEVGRKTDGLGVLTIAVRSGGVPVNGYRISIRKGGAILGSDITTGEGLARFRLLYGMYECIVQNRAGAIRAIPVTFDDSHPDLTIEL